MYGLRKEITALYFVVTVNHLLSAPPPPSNKPSLFRGRKLISHALFFSPPPLPFIFIISWQMIEFEISCRLIQDGLFPSWKFGFVEDPRLHEL